MTLTQKPKLVKRLYSVSLRNMEMIQELQHTGRFSSQSDVIRQALALLYDKYASSIAGKEVV